MSSNLANGLRLAALGLKIFPLSAGSKRPPLISDWEAGASDDQAKVTEWATKHPGCNWGVACGPSGLTVLDVDTKKSKAGLASLCGLELDNGDLETLRVQTPTGGLHLYMRGTTASSVERVAPGLDVRSDGGYVVAPLCVVDGKPYTISRDAPILQAPSWFTDLAGKPNAKAEQTLPACELDTPTALARAAAYLTQSEPAVEGNGGDALTLRVAMHVKDLGLSEAACLELMASIYNPRCSPPWSMEELTTKVKNSYSYGSNAPGCDAPEAAFAGIEAPTESEPTKPVAATVDSIKAYVAADIDPTKIPKREWLLGYRYIPGYVTLTIAPGGVGKSMLSIHEALALASGRGAMVGLQTVIEPRACWLYNTEDPRDEMERRIAAAAIHHGIGGEVLRRVHYASGQDQPLILVASQGKGPIVNTKKIDEICKYIDTNTIKLLVLDPFVRLYRGLDENDNAAIDVVVQCLSKIATRTGCSVSVVHHTNKKFGTEGSEGDMNASRGASSLASAARIAHTVCGMSEKFAKEYGIPNADRKLLVRLDDAKANMAPPQDGCTWFRKVSQQLPNGDSVGVLSIYTLPPKVHKTGGDTQEIDGPAEERAAMKAEKSRGRKARV